MVRARLALLLLGACNVIGGIDQAVAECRIDGVANGRETGIDCGGPCGKCPDWQACTNDSDCANNACDDALCWPAACADGRRNGYETDIDCGGEDYNCARCWGGESCLEDDDCTAVFSTTIPQACLQGYCVSLCCGTEPFADCEGCSSCPVCPVGALGSNCDDTDCLDDFNCIETDGPWICL